MFFKACRSLSKNATHGIPGSAVRLRHGKNATTMKRLVEQLQPLDGLHSSMVPSTHASSTRWFASSSGNVNVNPQTGQDQQGQQNDSGGGDGDGPSGNSSGSNWFIRFGWTLLGLLAIDQILQYQQKNERGRILKELQEEANEQNPVPSQWTNDDADSTTAMATKYQCKVVHVERSLDGTLVLRDVTVGDVVDILEEGVGPNADYHLCRCRRRMAVSSIKSDSNSGSIGWYPIKYLEKL